MPSPIPFKPTTSKNTVNKEPLKYLMRYTNHIGGHPVQTFLNKAVELVIADRMPSPFHSTFPYGSYEAVYCVIDNQIASAMCFERNKFRAIDIHWAYVLEKYRRCGLHTAMHDAVKSIAVRDGYARIIRNVHADNTVMIRAIQAQGGVLHSHCYVETVCPKDEKLNYTLSALDKQHDLYELD
jgi:GNAT superfamily N-acetyltransferase